MKYTTLLIIGLFLWSSCDDDVQPACDQGITISSDFDNISSDEFTIIEAEINGQCLDVTIGAGGCDGESWTTEMYRAEVMLTVFPPTIPLKLSLDDDEDCEAFIQRTFSFDLSDIIADHPQFYLSIEGLIGTLEYTTVALGNLTGRWDLVNVNGGLAGTNIDFEPGEVTWNISSESIIITDNLAGNTVGLGAGTYEYQVLTDGNDEFYELEVGGQNLGYIRYLTEDSFSVDQRALDGLQYVFVR